MENHRLVLPEHLNHYGFLFGGHLLKWVDEFAYIAATIEYPGYNFVTIGMDFLARVLVVVFAWRGSQMRIISARRASRAERREYEDSL